MVNRIGRYEIQAELGRGGFGHVFRAFDPVMDSMVAIKTLIGDTEPDVLTRFRNEAAAARKLQHKNIITVYDFGEENRVPYIVMELLEGEDLDRAIRSARPLTLLQKMLIMSEVAGGLNYAHSRGVVHRDVKPANIMLLSDGSVKIMDFGIALVTQATGQRLTPQGTIMGSFRYMAPEQFEGLPSDALSDIFAFGVIYYQLVTGKHPFEASEAAAVMRKIIRAEPTPIRELCPACPEPLEQILQRLLQKDRDLRYRSLEEVQFDVEPILLDLQKTHAADLLRRARDLVARDQGDTAQVLVKEILRFDPGNTGARELRETLQQQSQKKLSHARVAALLKTGHGKLEQQDFSSAIESFESALRLDRSNSEIQKLVEQARAAMEQAHRAHALVDEAQRAFDSRNLTGAFNKASEALQLDPRNNSAAVLLETIRRETEARERERRLQDGLSRAKSSLMLQAYDEAVTLLQQLQPAYPESSEVAELLAKARLEKTIQAKRQRLQAGLEHGKDLLRHKRLADAVQVLEQLDREFHEITAVRDLLSYAREELAATRRREAVAQASEAARAFLDSQEFDRAIDTLKDALQSFPGEDSLSNLLQSAISGKAEAERQKALAEAMQTSQSLVAEHRYREALECIDAFQSRHAADPALSDLRKRAQAQWDLQQRIDAMGRILGEARGLIEQGRASTATRLLHDATARYPDDPQLAALLQLAETRLLEQKRAEAVEQAVGQAASFTEMFQFDRAAEVVEEGLKKYPEDSALKRSLEATRLARSGHQRETEKQAAIERARQLHRAGQFADALSGIETALRAYAGDSDLLALKKQIEANWETRNRTEAVQKILGQAGAQLDQGLTQQAIALLEESLRKYPDDAELRSLLARAQQEHQARQRTEAVRQCVSAAEDLIRALQFDRAMEMLDKALQSYPGEQALVRVREAALAARGARQREEARQKAIEQAAALYREGRFADALSVLDSALLVQPDDPSLLSTRKRVQADWDLRQRQDAVAEAGTQARGLLNQGHLERAIVILEDALRRYPDASDLGALLASTKDALRARERNEDVRRRITEAEGLATALHFDRALKVLEKGLKSYPDEPAILRSREAIIDARAAHNHEKTRQEILKRAGELHRSGRFGDALRIIESALPEYPEDPDLLAAKVRIELDWEIRKRNDAVQQIVRQAKQFLDQGEPEQAISRLEEGLRRYPGDSALTPLLERSQEQLRAKQAEQLRRREQASAPVQPVPVTTESVLLVEREDLRRTRPPRRLILITAGIVAALVAGLMGLYRYLNRPLEIHLERPAQTASIPPESSIPATSVPPIKQPATPRVIPETAQQPTGTLAVSTGMADVLIFVDDRKYGQTSADGILRIPLDAKNHTVRVSKPGYNAQPPQQTARVRKGEQALAVFKLDPISKNSSVEAPAQSPKPGNRESTVATGVAVPPPPPVIEPQQGPKQPPNVEPPPAADPETQLWSRIASSGKTAEFEQYKNQFPNGAHIADATRRIEELDWAQVDHQSRAGLEKFLGKHGSGKYAAQVKIELAELGRRNQLNVDGQAVRETLNQYVKGYNNLNADLVRNIYPNVSYKKLKESFKNGRQTVELQIGELIINGDSAVVVCRQSHTATEKASGETASFNGTKTFSLRKSSNGWVIEDIK